MLSSGQLNPMERIVSWISTTGAECVLMLVLDCRECAGSIS